MAIQIVPEDLDIEQAECIDDVPLPALEPLIFRASKARTCARRRVPLSERIGTFCGIVACLGVLWFVDTQSGRIDVMNEAVGRLTTQLQRTDATNAVLAAQAAALVTPQRVLSVAVNRDHMTFASPIHIPRR